MTFEPRKIVSQKQRTISTYPSIEDLVKKEKRKQIADNMKFWAEKKVVFRQHNTTLK
jgi:hypothetical protein